MESKGKAANTVRSFKKVMSLLLALLFISSSFLAPFNFVYAEDNGELDIKTIAHPEAKNIAIDGTKVTIKLPYGYDSNTLKLENLKYTNDLIFKSVEISFPSDTGSEAEVDGPSVIMDVSYSYDRGVAAPRNIPLPHPNTTQKKIIKPKKK